jgi:ABC-type dipeptide/oligopeptide/nickel transport system ATPase component
LKVLVESRGLWERTGCVWYSACPFRMDRCAVEVPELVEIEEGHYSACFLGLGEPQKAAPLKA